MNEVDPQIEATCYQLASLVSKATRQRDWVQVAACIDRAAMRFPGPPEPPCPIGLSWPCRVVAFQADEYIYDALENVINEETIGPVSGVYVANYLPLSKAVISALKRLKCAYSERYAQWPYPHLMMPDGGLMPATWRVAYKIFLDPPTS